MLKIVYIILLAFSFSYAQNKLPLISPQDAYRLLNDKNTVFIDTEDNQTYMNEHIPGSVNIDVLVVQDVAIKNNEKQKCKYLPLCPKTAEKLFSENGISNNDKVIIYYSKNLPNKASYMWFLLYSMGHDENKLLILDGGLENWKKENLPISNQDDVIKKKAKYTVKPRYEVVASKEEVLQHIKNYTNGIDDNTILVDTRTFLEFTGRQEMNEIKRSGHIPGAKFVYWRWFEGKGSTYKPIEVLEKDVIKINLDLNKKIILYCTIGNRSSFVFIPLKYLGAKNLKIYTGSWYEWGNDESLPLETEKYRR